MRKKKIISIFLISFVMLACYLGITALREYTLQEVMGIRLVDGADVLRGKEKYDTEVNTDICFENTLIPCSRSNGCLYLPQNMQKTQWEGKVSTGEGTALYAPRDPYWADKAKAIAEGHEFTLWQVSDEGYSEWRLVISGMPILSINTEGSEEPEEVIYEEDPDKYIFDSETRYLGTFRLFDPCIHRNSYEIVEAKLDYHLKGMTSTCFEKEAYTLGLLDQNGERLNVPLLGMRSDNSWKLNALVTDKSRIREKTAAQIWEKIDRADQAVREPGPRMEYVELVLDDDYRGLYCLVEPVDAKKLELDEEDKLYKVIGMDVPEEEDFLDCIELGWKICGSVRMRYPREIPDYESAWYSMRDYINTFYRGQPQEAALNKVYPANIADMMIFTMAVSASDNCFKNMYYAADARGTEYRMRQLPWDLDFTFGNRYAYNEENYTLFDPDVTVMYQEEAALRLVQNNPDSFCALLRGRWKSYRKGILDTSAIRQILCENRDYLAATGVMGRENARWPEYQMSADIEELLQYQTDRMEWLDGYFGSLP